MTDERDEVTELDHRPQSRREWSGYLRSLVLPLAFVALIVGSLLYYQAREGSGSGDSPYGTVELPPDRNATGREPSAEQGRAAPDFLLESLDGQVVRFSDLQGRPVLVNFWASWCAPCRQEMPRLVEAYLEHSDDGLVLLAVDVREAEERARAFAEEFTLPFTVLLDRDGEVASTWRIGGPTGGLPSSYFVDASGVVRQVVYGPVNDRNLAEGLDLILNNES